MRFDTYCAPLLHLAGIKVSVIRTEGEGQAKDILEVVKALGEGIGDVPEG